MTAGWLPPGGRGLDLACGPGAGALWLAERGFTVEAVDISPVALDRLRAAAAEHGYADRVEVVEADLDDGLPGSLTGPYDVLLCLWFRWPHLSEVAARRLAPGGVVVATALSQVGREARAHSAGADPRFLAAPGELVERLAGLEVLHHEEGGGEAAIIARR